MFKSLKATFLMVMIPFVNLCASEDKVTEYFNEALEVINNDYVKEVEKKELVQHAIAGMLNRLDPYSELYTLEEFKEISDFFDGNFGGIGVEVIYERGFLKVISPYEASPAFKKGVKIGDYITSVDGELIKDLTFVEAISKMRGAPGTNVEIGIYRPQTSEVLALDIERDKLDTKSTKYFLIDNEILYVNIISFNKKTASDFIKVYREVNSNLSDKIKGIVLDLRYSPGGTFEEALEMSDIFLDGGKIVSTVSRKEELNNTAYAKDGDITKGTPIVVIINEGTASSAEIISAALKENDRAILIGRKSFGKGSIQNISAFGDGAIKLTVAEFVSPQGNKIQDNGVEPHITVEEQSFLQEGKSEEEKEQDKIYSKIDRKEIIPDVFTLSSEEYIDNYELLRAIDLLKGLIILKKVS